MRVRQKHAHTRQHFYEGRVFLVHTKIPRLQIAYASGEMGTLIKGLCFLNHSNDLERPHNEQNNPDETVADPTALKKDSGICHETTHSNLVYQAFLKISRIVQDDGLTG